MHPSRLSHSLRFYFITDDQAPALSALEQVRAALRGGAGCVQYRNKAFRLPDYEEVRRIRDVCRTNGVTLLINDNVLLARAVGADGVHLGQTDADPREARAILGPAALIGVSVSTPAELRQTDLAHCDYVGSGPVFATGTKADAKPVRGIDGLAEIVRQIPLPVVAIGGITPPTARPTDLPPGGRCRCGGHQRCLPGSRTRRWPPPNWATPAAARRAIPSRTAGRMNST